MPWRNKYAETRWRYIFPLAALLALKVAVRDITCVSIIRASSKSELVEVHKARGTVVKDELALPVTSCHTESTVANSENP